MTYNPAPGRLPDGKPLQPNRNKQPDHSKGREIDVHPKQGRGRIANRDPDNFKDDLLLKTTKAKASP